MNESDINKYFLYKKECHQQEKQGFYNVYDIT